MITHCMKPHQSNSTGEVLGLFLKRILRIIIFLRKSVRNFGYWAAINVVLYKLINVVTYFRVFKCMSITLSDLDTTYLHRGKKYQCSFVKKEELIEFVKDRELDMDEAFIKKAFAKGDECFGIFRGPILVNYAWYSKSPTYIDNELILHFKNDYVYVYKAYTRKNYRGQHLPAMRAANALGYYSNEGFKGLIAYVESVNYDALKCVYRVGYKDFGMTYVLKILNKHLIFASKRCIEYDIWIEIKQ
jgi:hypothetical protein